MRHTLPSFLLSLVALGAATPAAADPPAASPAAPPDEPRMAVELESSSHVVRREEERLLVRYDAGAWDFEGLVASVAPRFREDRDQIGLAVSRLFGAAELTAVARMTDKPGGEDTVLGVRYTRPAANAAYGADVVWGRADLRIDDYLVGDGEQQLAGRAFWRRKDGFEVALFGAASATYDLMRGAGELLERLPRSKIVGAETLTDLDVDEARLEDSAGVAVGFRRPAWRARVYAKSGRQLVRGVLEKDDFMGYGGEVHVAARQWSLDAELDLRRLDTAGGFDSFDRGRVLVDFRHRPGRLEWGVGGYVQGEAQSFDEIPDLYDTAGLGFTASWQRASGRRLGLWLTWEDDSPDLQVMSRLALFSRSREREYGVGVRRDEVGPTRFKDETYGPFLFGSLPLGRVVIQGDVGVQDGDAYGRLTIGLKR